MDKYKIVVSYDGTDYYGWQVQTQQESVAQELQDTFERVFDESIKLLGASRTDAGVHALGQVAVFEADVRVNTNNMLFAWNNLLPQSIRILSIEKVDKDFHPYRTKAEKTYWYHFFINSPLPFAARYGWYIHRKIDFEKLKHCLNVFIGTHDFASFCTKNEKETTVRTINSIALCYVKEFDCYRIEINGPGFLRHMVRRIVGASITVATKSDLTVQYVQDVLNEKNPNNAMPTAPAHGLFLKSIEYL